MKIFISHSKHDNDLVKIIIAVLKKYNVDHWVDWEQLELGKEVELRINEGLRDSTHFLLVSTKNVLDSFWVRAERAAAIELGDRLTKISFKLDETPLGVPFASFLRPSVNKENLGNQTEQLLNEIGDFGTQVNLFRNKVADQYVNLPQNEKPIISNFKKFDGGKYYVEQHYRNLSTNEVGSEISRYVLELIRTNISKIEETKILQTKLCELESQLKDIGFSPEILQKIQPMDEKDDFRKLKLEVLRQMKFDEVIIKKIERESMITGAIKSIQNRLSKIRSYKKKLEQLPNLKNSLKELETEENSLIDPQYLVKASETQILERNQRLLQIPVEKKKLGSAIGEIETLGVMMRGEILQEEEILKDLEKGRKDLEIQKELDEKITEVKEKAEIIVLKLSEARKIQNSIDSIGSELTRFESEKLVPVIGDYGSGKSAMCHNVFVKICMDEQIKKYPIFIPLGQLTKHNDNEDHLVEDIYDFMINEYKFNITKSDFQNRLEDGQFIFILDALDEMSNKLDNVIAQNNLNYVIKLAKNNVVLLTSRHTYLSESMEQKLLIDYNRLIKILDFTPEEIKKYLRLYLGRNSSRIEEISRVIEGETIGDLSRKPLFLYVIVNNFDNMKDYFPINESVILRMLTDEWIKHDVLKKSGIGDEQKTSLMNERQIISEILAVTEYRKGKPIGIEDIKSEVKEALRYSNPEAEQKLDQYYKDAITATFLIKEENEKFRFILNPVIEYFVARCIVDDVKNCDMKSFLQHVEMIKSTETFDFVKGIIDIEWSIKSHVLKEVPPENPNYKYLKSFENLSKLVFDSINDIRIQGLGQKVGNLIRILHITGNLPHRPNLSGLNISNTNLSGSNLTGANLKKATMNEINLRGSDLSDTKLVEAKLVKAKLIGLDLRNADLTGADLSNADLTGSDLRDAILTDANLTGATLTLADLRNTVFSERTLLRRAKLIRANIVGLDLRKPQIENTDFTGVDFQDAKLGKNLRGIILRDCNLDAIKLSQADLTGADFRDSNLTNAVLNEAVLQNADLRWSKIIHADLFRTSLRYAKLQESDLLGCDNIDTADLEGANLKGAMNLSISVEEARNKGAII